MLNLFNGYQAGSFKSCLNRVSPSVIFIANFSFAQKNPETSFLYTMYAKKNTTNSLVNKSKQVDDNKTAVLFSKHFPPAIKEWTNSVFTYNPNLTISLSVIDKMVIKLIKSYFNSYYLEDVSKNHLPPKKRQLRVINKVYVSKPEFKHTNSKVIITLYIFADVRKQLD
jgi:hypothetical protein